MRPALRFRLRVEQTLCFASGVLALLTVVVPSWLEAMFGVDPDHGNGTAEWLLVAGFIVFAATCGVAARHDHTRLVAAKALADGA